jgi:EAL domain-containing protein (putative c-di-GMP-specific phosphodiesterase class I)
VAVRRNRWTLPEFGAAPPSAEVPDRTTRSLRPPDLSVVFQPIVALSSGQTFAAEALVRCHWPEYADPTELFRHAAHEQTCGRLGRMIREITFGAALEMPVFVNVHPQELASRWLVRPDDPINFAGADVYIEVTESATLEHFDLCVGTLAEVCSRTGARLAIDDFGAGYSNLRRVAELEPAVIKLDRELIRGIDGSRRLQRLVRCVVTLCQEMGAKVVAEGIESLAELKAVRDAGVDYAQGFLLARPGHPLPSVRWPRLTPASRSRDATHAARGSASERGSPPSGRSTERRSSSAGLLRGAVEEVSEPRSKPPGRLAPKRTDRHPSESPSKHPSKHPSKRPSKRPSGPPHSVRRR